MIGQDIAYFSGQIVKRCVRNYIFNIVLSDIPVSYTHLDVYKRQPFQQCRVHREDGGAENALALFRKVTAVLSTRLPDSKKFRRDLSEERKLSLIHI